MKKTIKSFTCILSIAVAVIFAFQIYFANELPDSFNIKKGESLDISDVISVANNVNSQSVSLKMFGIIPIKEVELNEIDDYEVCVSGELFGIKIFTKGVMVVGVSAVDTATGQKNPASDAGIKIGDNILTINGKSVTSNEDIAQIIKNSGGNSLEVVILRNGNQKNLELFPTLSKSGEYKAGIWVRDSSAGMGTMTFYNPITKVYAGLGHAICDVDTGQILSLSNGEIVGARVRSISKSVNGKSGSLCGEFSGGRIGSLLKNCELGVYGVLDNCNYNEVMTVALKQQVQVGDAYILTSIDGKTPQKYSCRILKIRYNNAPTQNMIIEITDNNLISKTGGIVQGMSGSPIIQNGKLIGAVTHVLVDDPTRGYAIFAENMLETAQSVAESNKLKEAS